MGGCPLSNLRMAGLATPNHSNCHSLPLRVIRGHQYCDFALVGSASLLTHRLMAQALSHLHGRPSTHWAIHLASVRAAEPMQPDPNPEPILQAGTPAKYGAMHHACLAYVPCSLCSIAPLAFTPPRNLPCLQSLLPQRTRETTGRSRCSQLGCLIVATRPTTPHLATRLCDKRQMV